MNNVVDEVLNTSATDNKVKYKITYSNNTSDIVELDLYTPVTTQGTPINRTLFESIRTDLTNLNNNKENVSNKTNTISSSSTTTQYPNAKAVYNYIQNNVIALIELSNSYSEWTLTTGSRTYTQSFTNANEWTIVNDLEAIHNKSGFVLSTTSIEEVHPIRLAVDRDASTNAWTNNTYFKLSLPNNFQLVNINAKASLPTGYATGNLLRIGTESTLGVSGQYSTYSINRYADATNNTYTFSITASNIKDYYMACFYNGSKKDMVLWELNSIKYTTPVNILTSSYSGTLTNGTVLKIHTQSNLTSTNPTVLVIGSNEYLVGRLNANSNYEFVYWNNEITIK